MEEFITAAFQSGNATAIIAAAVVYVIIYIQRKNTSVTRDNTSEKLLMEIAKLKQENELKQKDIDYLMAENNGVKEDIKEMKNTLNQMAISLATIAAKYNNKRT
jgi:uncharacterized protein YoxC